MTEITTAIGSPFDAIRQVRADGSEYWSARDLMPLLGYPRWQDFTPALSRAIVAADAQGLDRHDLFRGNPEKSGGRPREDFHMVRFACYLVAMNGDPRKPEVAAAQAYFAIQTRVAETAPVLTGPELLARALVEANEVIAAADARVLELTPKAEAFDAFLSTAGDYSLNEAAKVLARDGEISIGEHRLRDKLQAWRWLYRSATGKPRAMQTQVDCGRLVEKAQWHYHPSTGEKVLDAPQVRITAKGLEAIRRRILNEASGLAVTA